MINYIRSIGLISLVEFLLKFKSIVLLPFITNQFTPLDYGVWSQFGVVYSTLQPLVMLGTDAAFAQLIPGSSSDERDRALGTWLLFLVGMSLLFGLVFFSFSGILTTLLFGEDKQYHFFMKLAIVSLFLNIFVSYLRMVIRILGNSVAYTISTALQAVLEVLVVIYVLHSNLSIKEWVLYSCFATAITLAYLAPACRLRNLFPIQPDWQIMKRAVKIGVRTIPAAYAMWAILSFDRIMLTQYIGMDAVGIYSILFSFGYTIIQIFANPIWTMYPTAASEYYNRNERQNFQKIFDIATGSTLFICLPAVIGLYILSPFILKIMVHSGYIVDPRSMGIISASYLLLMITGYLEMPLVFYKKVHLQVFSVIFSGIVNVGLNFLFIPSHGIAGAALSTFIAFSTRLALAVFYNQKLRIYSINKAFVMKTTVISAAMALFVFGCSKFTASRISPAATIIICAAAGFVSYMFLATALGITRVMDVKRVIKKVFLRRANVAEEATV